MDAFEEMDLPEVYTELVAMDECILIAAKYGIDDPAHHERREQIAAVIQQKWPSVPTEAFATI